ncbi:outer membrane protein [Vibrio mangrovi]|uniref:Outer membrane beta-barrel protein n=1 Tax=Vibrio mangrovi TaxID=474394 RepID=A0A1Y6J0B4_9VIBR|nr:outer membrane beta-barrel protein [Vibrio mangrovi]MDW6002412.1 outer membrane beta-barrel protein [Vibrio mangrovi]SMS02691.1 hypothetical protein VIM7927_04026 [Vibrio mangrovi]
MKKKILLTIPGLILVSASAGVHAADYGLYTGVAAVHSGFVVDEGANTKEQDHSMTSAGVFVGYKHPLISGLFVAGEAFYNDTAQNNHDSNGDTVNVESQYGVKAHLGHDWKWGGSAYVIAGLANLEYDVTLDGQHADQSGFGLLYGIGAGYQFSDNLSTNFEVSFASDEINVAGDDKSTSLIALRLGLAYHF